MNPFRFLSIALLAVGASASAATLPYQGLLTDANGVPVANGDKAVTFGLYSQATGGTALWSEARTVTTTKGLFSVALGAVNPIDDDVFAKDTVFLGISLSGSELVARTPLGMAPFAFRAHKADTANFARAASVDLTSYAKTTDLASYAKTSALASYATTASLASYATTASVAGKMSTSDYVANGQLKALGGLTGGRGYDGVFNGSKITLDTTEVSMEAGDRFTTLGQGQLIWGYGYNQWRISAEPGSTFSLFSGNRMFDMAVLNITTAGEAQFTGDVKIDGALTLKTAAAIVPDYVFEPEYRLAPLSEVEAYTQANKHLPDVPSAAELETSGVDMVRMNLILLRKVEELTLHAIELEKRMKAMEARSN